MFCNIFKIFIFIENGPRAMGINLCLSMMRNILTQNFFRCFKIGMQFINNKNKNAIDKESFVYFVTSLGANPFNLPVSKWWNFVEQILKLFEPTLCHLRKLPKKWKLIYIKSQPLSAKKFFNETFNQMIVLITF